MQTPRVLQDPLTEPTDAHAGARTPAAALFLLVLQMAEELASTLHSQSQPCCQLAVATSCHWASVLLLKSHLGGQGGLMAPSPLSLPTGDVLGFCSHSQHRGKRRELSKEEDISGS